MLRILSDLILWYGVPEGKIEERMEGRKVKGSYGVPVDCLIVLREIP